MPISAQGDLEAARETIGKGAEALEDERRAYEQTKIQAREAEVLAGEREKRIAALEAALKEERAGRRDQDEALTALPVEAATLAERAAHVDVLRGLLKTLQERQGGAPKRRARPEG